MWQQVNKNDTRILGAAIIGTQLSNFDDLKFYSNLLAIFPELLKSMGEDFIRNLIAQKNQSLASKLDFKNPCKWLSIFIHYPWIMRQCVITSSLSCS